MPKPLKTLCVIADRGERIRRDSLPPAEEYIVFRRKLKATHVPTGAECSFYKLKNGVGAKVYFDRGKAFRAYNTQRRLSGKWLAPSVLSPLSPFYGNFYKSSEHAFFGVGERFERTVKWGFLTEVARMSYATSDEDLKELANKLSFNRVCEFDINEINTGWLNGRLVLVDCGPLTTGI
jgi:hypothetical protein